MAGMDGTASPEYAQAAGPAARVHAGNARSVRLVPENNARGKGKEPKVFPSGKATMEFLGLSRNWYYNLVRLGKPFNGWIIHHTIDKAASKAAHKAVHARFGKSGKGASDKKGGKSPKEPIQGSPGDAPAPKSRKRKMAKPTDPDTGVAGPRNQRQRQHDAAAAVLASMAAQPESPGTDGAGAAKIDVDELAIAALRAAVAGSTANVNEVVGALLNAALDSRFPWLSLARVLEPNAVPAAGMAAVAGRIAELLKFLVVKVFEDDLDASVLSPSPIVEKDWHDMLRFPNEYLSLCNSLMTRHSGVAATRAEVIGCNPLEAKLPEHRAAYEQRYAQALKLHFKYFNADPGVAYWPKVLPPLAA